MSAAPNLIDLDSDETSAPPRANGELVFAEPWESRAFGMALTLHDSGLFAWPQFQAALIARIAGWENHHPEGECFSYYTQRAEELAARPAGHDHRDDEHGHGHGHGHGH